jgi:hypothetical protein
MDAAGTWVFFHRLFTITLYQFLLRHHSVIITIPLFVRHLCKLFFFEVLQYFGFCACRCFASSKLSA